MASPQFVGLKPRTVRCYKRALGRFLQFVEEEEGSLPSSYRALDRLLGSFIEHMWLDDEPITYAGHLLSGLRRFLLEARWRIPRARQYYTNWQSVHVTKQAAPLPPEVIMAFAGLAIATKQPELAALLLVAYLAFLRTGEFVSLSPAKVAVDTRRGLVLVALPSTKTSRQREETVCVEHHRVPKLVASVLPNLRGAPFWDGTRVSFRSLFTQFIEFFSLEQWSFTPYSIRRGGASHAFATGSTFDELKVKGRWQSDRTARLYLDTGRAALIQTQFALSHLRLISHYASILYRFCEQLR